MESTQTNELVLTLTEAEHDYLFRMLLDPVGHTPREELRVSLAKKLARPSPVRDVVVPSVQGRLRNVKRRLRVASERRRRAARSVAPA